jgi:hypothetical protein
MLFWDYPRELVVTPFAWWGYMGWALIALSYVVAIRKRKTEFGLFCIALGLHLVLLDVMLAFDQTMFPDYRTFAIQVLGLKGPRRLLTAQLVPLVLAGPAIFLNIRRSDARTAHRRLLGAFFALADVVLLIGWLAALTWPR